MNKLSKFLALTLILASVVSVFAVLPAFAAEIATPKASDYGTVVYDMDGLGSKSLTISTPGGALKDPTMKKNEDGIWEYSFPDSVDPSVAGDGGEYWTIAPSSIYINNRYTGTLVDNGDGTFTDNRVIKNNKNTDYLVIDFDIGSSSGALLEGFYFHNRWYGQSGSTSTSNDASQQYYVMFNGTDLSNFSVSTYQSSGAYVQPAKTPGEWLNVTLIYDFSAVDEYGYAVPSEWVAYVYFDGIYCGTIGVPSAKAVQHYFNRVSTPTGIEYGKDCSTLFKNFTYTTFGRGYAGPMTESGMLGYTGINLSELPDLAYTQANTPSAEDKLMATIERVGEAEPIEVYSFDELDASLKDGDVVTLYRSITSTLIMDSNATVTFKDTAGTVLTPGVYGENDLVHIAAVVTADFTEGKILRVRNLNPNFKGARVAPEPSFVDVLTNEDTIVVGTSSAAIGSEVDYRYILMGDFDWEHGGSVRMYGDQATFDLNGYKMNLSHAVRAFNVDKDHNGRVIFKNGKLTICSTTGSDLAMTNSTSLIVFDCLEELELKHANTFIDQRGGAVILHDIERMYRTPYSYGETDTTYEVCTIVSSKSSGNNRSSLYIESVNLDLTKESERVPEGGTYENCANAPFLVNNVASSGSRQGSMHNFVYINDSAISIDNENVIEYTAFANSTGTLIKDEAGVITGWTQTPAYAINENEVKTVVNNSDLDTGAYNVFIVKVDSFYSANKGTKADPVYFAAEEFSYNLDFTFNNCTLKGAYALYQYTPKSVPEDLDYVYEVNVDFNSCDIDHSVSLIDHNSNDDMNVSLSDGSRMSSMKLVEDGDADINLILPEGSELAYTSINDQYNVIVTPSFEPYAYKLGNLDPTDFLWNLPAEGTDPVEIDRVIIPESKAGAYKYEWEISEDGKLYSAVIDKDFKISAKSNLTLYDNIFFNFYVKADLYDASKAYLTVTDLVNEKELVGELVSIDGSDYYKFQVKDLAPTMAEDKIISFVMHVDGAYNDSYNLEKTFSIYDYCSNILSNAKTDDDEIVRAIVNYLKAAYTVDGKDAQNLAKLIEGVEFDAVSGAEAEGGSEKDLTIAINYGPELNWIVKAEAGKSYTVKYTVNGNEITTTKTANENGFIYLTVKACDFLSDVTVGEAKMNIVSYYNSLATLEGLTDEQRAEAQMMVTAIYNYAKAALAYKTATNQ
ncbi:MAG: hypothetical protein IKC32_03825 [Clostridia bacterium]|nr:hypothetical protein [Clostridia bacterium]